MILPFLSVEALSFLAIISTEFFSLNLSSHTGNSSILRGSSACLLYLCDELKWGHETSSETTESSKPSLMDSIEKLSSAFSSSSSPLKYCDKSAMPFFSECMTLFQKSDKYIHPHESLESESTDHSIDSRPSESAHMAHLKSLHTMYTELGVSNAIDTENDILLLIPKKKDESNPSMKSISPSKDTIVKDIHSAPQSDHGGLSLLLSRATPILDAYEQIQTSSHHVQLKSIEPPHSLRMALTYLQASVGGAVLHRLDTENQEDPAATPLKHRLALKAIPIIVAGGADLHVCGSKLLFTLLCLGNIEQRTGFDEEVVEACVSLVCGSVDLLGLLCCQIATQRHYHALADRLRALEVIKQSCTLLKAVPLDSSLYFRYSHGNSSPRGKQSSQIGIMDVSESSVGKSILPSSSLIDPKFMRIDRSIPESASVSGIGSSYASSVLYTRLHVKEIEKKSKKPMIGRVRWRSKALDGVKKDSHSRETTNEMLANISVKWINELLYSGAGSDPFSEEHALIDGDSERERGIWGRERAGDRVLGWALNAGKKIRRSAQDISTSSIHGSDDHQTIPHDEDLSETSEVSMPLSYEQQSHGGDGSHDYMMACENEDEEKKSPLTPPTFALPEPTLLLKLLSTCASICSSLDAAMIQQYDCALKLITYVTDIVLILNIRRRDDKGRFGKHFPAIESMCVDILGKMGVIFDKHRKKSEDESGGIVGVFVKEYGRDRAFKRIETWIRFLKDASSYSPDTTTQTFARVLVKLLHQDSSIVDSMTKHQAFAAPQCIEKDGIKLPFKK
ncbi:hypothetical protein ADUPG1_013833 [Aduncisulcus paluster]|uniref:Uncharacterized protein n=1 Tax=Aduncisulcus paluster TaxID=2918883 RepID=A0ABQ5K968_9EUKA|nr:hypothetical protein ADUPG1_013833 [Aduncisulcus paluster]